VEGGAPLPNNPAGNPCRLRLPPKNRVTLNRLCSVQFISIRINQVEGRHGEEVEKEENREEETCKKAGQETSQEDGIGG
jgi:hypothetical protein